MACFVVAFSFSLEGFWILHLVYSSHSSVVLLRAFLFLYIYFGVVHFVKKGKTIFLAVVNKASIFFLS